MTWLYEDASTILYGGAACVIVLTIVLLQVGRGTALLGLVISSLLVGLLLLVEQNVVTERERVEATLTAVSEALEANDTALLFKHLSQSNPGLRRDAEGFASRIKIERVRIGSDLKIVVNELTSPPSATATFTTRVQYEVRRGNLPYKNFVIKVKLTLQQEQGQWKITGYDLNPMAGI